MKKIIRLIFIALAALLLYQCNKPSNAEQLVIMVEKIRAKQNGHAPTEKEVFASVHTEKFHAQLASHEDSNLWYKKTSDSEYEVSEPCCSIGASRFYNSRTKEWWVAG